MGQVNNPNGQNELVSTGERAYKVGDSAQRSRDLPTIVSLKRSSLFTIMLGDLRLQYMTMNHLKLSVAVLLVRFASADRKRRTR